jgi:hypothetical protein
MHTASLVRDLVGPVEPLVGRGLANTKFRGDGVLVRVNETSRAEVALGRFRKAAFCAEVAASCGVPVPDVLAVGTLPNGRPYSVERWVDDADPADEITDADRRARIWLQLGAAIGRVHAVALAGREHEYALGYDGEGPTLTWDAQLAAVLPAIDADRSLGLTPGQKARAVAALQAFDLARHPLGLCHGDLKLDNVLVRGDDVVAIVDWELARYVPAVPGEFSTAVEPAVLPSKIGAVARTPAERDAFRRGLGGPDEADLWTFYLSDVATNLRWYPVALASDRPDVEVLRERFSRYLAGVREDLAALL